MVRIRHACCIGNGCVAEFFGAVLFASNKGGNIGIMEHCGRWPDSEWPRSGCLC